MEEEEAVEVVIEEEPLVKSQIRFAEDILPMFKEKSSSSWPSCKLTAT